MVIAILITFALYSAMSVGLSIRTTSGSRNKAAVVQIAARQRTLAERYLGDVLLAREGDPVDPTVTASLLSRSSHALLEGGPAPSVPGDDDGTTLPAAGSGEVRAQLRQEQRLVDDLTRTGAAVLANRSVEAVPLTAHEHIDTPDPIGRLRVLTAMTSNVSLDAARTIASGTDQNITDLIVLQVGLGILGLLTSLLLAWALISATRRQTAHFRSLVTSSTDLVLVLGAGGCRYASDSVTNMVGKPAADLVGEGFLAFVHPDDVPPLRAVYSDDGDPPSEMVFRMTNRFGETRFLEAHITDLRADRRITGVVLNARDATERVQLEQELTRQAFHDGLTNLANRALFRDRLDQSLARASRSAATLCVLLIDLDGFKQVNDTLGHDAGDLLLAEVAQRFAETSRPGDTLARLGGDEFALLLEEADERVGIAVAQRLLEVLSEPIEVAAHQLTLGASIGVVSNTGPGSSDDLVRHADVAMYAAKEAGRGRIELYRDGMARELGELLGLEHELRLGLKRDQFKVHYQPLIDLDSGSIIGVEALVRWQSPNRGLVAPDRFIPVAESTGLIVQLGAHVLAAACRQTAEWRSHGVLPSPFTTWVNVSGKQLSAGDVSALVRRTLAETGIPPNLLGLEVTETAIVVGGAAGERARKELQDLHDLGVRIAIDDFGTGFSSLAHLRSFPVDVIKVDRSFIQGVGQSAKDAAITANLASLAHSLGLVATAEGIESESQLESVRELGCDHAQGFLFARPVPAEQVSALLAGRAAGGEVREPAA
ncbi:MAG TPA: EAL domain-containing protein [Gaiellaceae bacterium]|jgi:diguanylate cyclase (GGDEF)-like protein/PAS domain S-box-containing protein|nr:EAL domain-containing protein [Gaiellaceae bacterium]